MFSFKKRKAYESPHTKVAQVDLEGLICTVSGFKTVQVDRSRNVNQTIDGPGTENYFEI